MPSDPSSNTPPRSGPPGSTSSSRASEAAKIRRENAELAVLRVNQYVSTALENLHDARWWAEAVPSEKEWLIKTLRNAIADLHTVTNKTKWKDQ